MAVLGDSKRPPSYQVGRDRFGWKVAALLLLLYRLIDKLRTMESRTVVVRIFSRTTVACVARSILQWNACSMNEEKRKQLEYLSFRNKIDVICISRLGRYRTISKFPNCVKSDIILRVPLLEEWIER